MPRSKDQERIRKGWSGQLFFVCEISFDVPLCRPHLRPSSPTFNYHCGMEQGKTSRNLSKQVSANWRAHPRRGRCWPRAPLAPAISVAYLALPLLVPCCRAGPVPTLCARLTRQGRANWWAPFYFARCPSSTSASGSVTAARGAGARPFAALQGGHARFGYLHCFLRTARGIALQKWRPPFQPRPIEGKSTFPFRTLYEDGGGP